MGVIISGDGTALPSPVSLQASEEIIWSVNTGRAENGLMLGDVIAEKRTFTIEWGVLTKAEYALIRAKLASGFHPFSVTIDGETEAITAYRGTITAELLGCFGGVTYYRRAAVTVIQQ